MNIVKKGAGILFGDETKTTEDTKTPKQEHVLAQELSQTNFQEHLQAKLRETVRYTLIAVLEAEVEVLIEAAPYQRIQ